MRKLNRWALAAGSAMILGLANYTSADDQTVRDETIVAPPETSQATTYQERTYYCTCPEKTVAYRPVGADGIAASPKMRYLIETGAIRQEPYEVVYYQSPPPHGRRVTVIHREAY